MKNLVLDRRSVQAVLQAVAHERTRYSLDAVQLENGAVRQLVATNGKWLIRNKFPKVDVDTVRAAALDPAIPGDGESKTLLPADFLNNTVKACRGVQSTLQDCKLIVDTTESKTGIRYLPDRNSGPAQMTGDTVDSSFPNFQPLFDKERDGIQWGMNIKILEGIVKAAKAVGSDTVHFQFPIPEVNKEVKEAVHFELDVTDTEIGSIDGLVMPVTR